MKPRIVGLETEFGCLVRDPSLGDYQRVVEAIKDHAFMQKRLGLIDLHARDHPFEPARAGGFLTNGGRLYVDAVGSHLEYATPECRSLRDVVCFDKAGQRMIQGLINSLGWGGKVSVYNNSVDHYGGHTFGCHENYSAILSVDFLHRAVQFLLPFLVTRQIFAGTGRVGGHRINRHNLERSVLRLSAVEADYLWLSDLYGVELDPRVDFQLSQRADHIVRTISSRVRFNRAIINPKRDSIYHFSDTDRLHVLYGESNPSEYAAMLKVGTTCLVLDLLEARAVPSRVVLKDPLAALRSVSRDPQWKWLVERADGTMISAVDLQRMYLSAAQRLCTDDGDEETTWVLREWERVLDGLAADPLSLADRLDWVAKFKLLDDFRGSERVHWQDEVMHSLDLQYHDVNPEQGLYYALVEQGPMRSMVGPEEIEEARTEPPRDTRARGRGRVVEGLLRSGARRYLIDWDLVYLGKDRHLGLPDPFWTYESEARQFLSSTF